MTMTAKAETDQAPEPQFPKLNYELVDYDQLLKQVSDFMEQSGIRHFCQTKCGGACCHFTKTGRCDYQQQDCINQPRLACNIWLCNSLYLFLHHLAKQQQQTSVIQFLNYYMHEFGITAILRLRRLTTDYVGDRQEAACYNQPTPAIVKANFQLAPTPNFKDEEIIKTIKALMAIITQGADDDPQILTLLRSNILLGPKMLEDIEILNRT